MMRRKGWLPTACALVLTAAMPVAAAEIGECNNLDSVSWLVGQTKSFSQGKVKIAHIDTDGEPVCCSSHLLVIIPAPELGSQCFALSQKAASKEDETALGFANIGFDKITTAYDAARGLLLTVPYTLYDSEGGKGKPGSARVRIDLRGDGSVKIEP